MGKNENQAAPFAADRAMQAYFNTLPKNLQEMFMQSGAKVSTEQELRQCVEQLRGRLDQ